ncbi:MAG TPA: FRG domain-containing protein [Fibrobacteraceae bacterium]|nr:FRG domain-containing protein [Fibrobacteraceae bacterium]
MSKEIASVLGEMSIHERENDIYCRTLVMAANDLIGYESSWQKLALFQHFNLPTRLLDWSSSLITAIMFAIAPCLECRVHCAQKNKCDRKEYNPRILMLDPQKMHAALHKDSPIGNLVAVTIGVDDKKLQDYAEVFITREQAWDLKGGPIFLEVPWRNARIRAQKGYFTFHPDDRLSFDDIIGHEDWLTEIIIEKKLLHKLRDEIIATGSTEYDLYPDIMHLAKYFARAHRKKEAQ